MTASGFALPLAVRSKINSAFPLLTTKRVYWKGVLHELYWFMSGQSNIKYLVDNNVHIWDDYPYKMYKAQSAQGKVEDLTKDEFVEQIAKNPRTFAGLEAAIHQLGLLMAALLEGRAADSGWGNAI